MWFEERRFRGSILGKGAKLILVFEFLVDEETCLSGSDLMEDLWMSVWVLALVTRILGNCVRSLSADEVIDEDSRNLEVTGSLKPALPLLSADEVADISRYLERRGGLNERRVCDKVSKCLVDSNQYTVDWLSCKKIWRCVRGGVVSSQ